jgi:hypothetical protein
MSPAIVTVEGSSGVNWQLAKRVEEITGESPLRFRRSARNALHGMVFDGSIGDAMLVGKSAGAAKIIDALSSPEGIVWCRDRKVVCCFIDCHRPGSNGNFAILRNYYIAMCFSTWQRDKWPMGSAVHCTCGRNSMFRQTGVNHRTILQSKETELMIFSAWSETNEEVHNEHDKQENSKN